MQINFSLELRSIETKRRKISNDRCENSDNVDIDQWNLFYTEQISL